MAKDELPSPRQTHGSEPGDDTPEIEDAYAPTGVPPEEAPVEDDTELLDQSARSLEADLTQESDLDDACVAAAAARSAQAADKDDTSDAESIRDEPGTLLEELKDQEPPDWDHELSPHKFVVELKRIESEVRRLLNGRDPKRKRKLGGTHRWLELEEDILSWRYAGRIDEPTLIRLQELIARRHHLFDRLRFLAGTRSTWNT